MIALALIPLLLLVGLLTECLFELDLTLASDAETRDVPACAPYAPIQTVALVVAVAIVPSRIIPVGDTTKRPFGAWAPLPL